MSTPPTRLYLLYHELRKAPSQYSYVLGTAEFREHANLFARLRDHPGHFLVPEVTFDDGHVSNCHLALPILEDAGLHATFFITVGWTGVRPGYMGWDELQRIHKAGHRIGAHGWSHTLLTHCNAAALKTELETARLTLEGRLGTPITTMSLPGGRFNARVLAACRAAGYTQVFTSIPRAERDPEPALVGRLNIRSGTATEWLESLLDPRTGTLAKIQRTDRLKTALKRSIGDRLYAKLWSVLNHQEIASESGEDATA